MVILQSDLGISCTENNEEIIWKKSFQVGKQRYFPVFDQIVSMVPLPARPPCRMKRKKEWRKSVSQE